MAPINPRSPYSHSIAKKKLFVFSISFVTNLLFIAIKQFDWFKIFDSSVRAQNNIDFGTAFIIMATIN